MPGGRLVLNFFNPDPIMIGNWLSNRPGSLQKLGSGEDPASGRRLEHWQTIAYDTAAQELVHTRLTEELDGDGAVVSKRYRTGTCAMSIASRWSTCWKSAVSRSTRFTAGLTSGLLTAKAVN